METLKGVKSSELKTTFDGDQCSHYCVMTQEAKQELKGILNSKDYYLNLDGTMAFSQETDPIKLCLTYLTKF